MLRDFRFALRIFGKRPGFSLMVVGILGLGMATTTAVLDLTNLLAWRLVPVEDADELVRVFTARHRGFVTPHSTTSYPDYVAYRDGNGSFEGLAASTDLELRFSGTDETRLVWGAAVSGNFFAVLRLRPFLGRGLSPDDDRPGSPPAIVISHRFWQRHGAAPDILGSVLTVEGEPFTVVGIGPERFTSTMAGTVLDFFLPIAHLPVVLSERQRGVLADGRDQRFSILGRLRPDASRASAQADLEVLAQRRDGEDPLIDEQERQITTTRASLSHPLDADRMRPSLRLFGAAVALLLVITCTNVAHLLLARSRARWREMAMRQALGAGRGTLLRQLLTESFLLAVGGGLVGLVLAWWARAFLESYAGAEFAGELRFDVRVIGGCFLVCLTATLIFGLAPALASSRIDLATAMKGHAEGDGRRRLMAGQALAAAQVGLCVVLLVAGALLTRSLWNRIGADFGFDDRHLLIAGLELPADYDREAGIAFFRQLRERAGALPGAEAVSHALLVPPVFLDVRSPFRLPEAPEDERSSRINFVGEGYFETMGISLLRGRVFRVADETSERAVVVVNQRLASSLWPGEDPLGRTIVAESRRADDPGPSYVVVGVVSDIGQYRETTDREPILYYASAQRYRARQQIVLRSSAAPEASSKALRDLLHEMDPRLVLANLRSGREHRRQAFVFESMQAQAVTVFAVLGFVLAVVGVFGVLSYGVSRRTREIGIRMALGAQGHDVRRQVVRQGLAIALAGAAIGLVATFAAARLVESLLYGVGAGDPWIRLGVLAAVLLAAGLAAYLPARRASRLDPLRALRHE